MSRPDGFDAMAAIGLILIGIGLWMIWPPAALIGIGAALLGIGLAGARARADRRMSR